MISDIIKEKFANKKIIVIGDLVADQFLSGTIDRVSREAPVFIMKHDETRTRPGGAANAAANVVALGGNAMAIGFIGEDANGRYLSESLEASGVDHSLAVYPPDFETTTKVRVLAGQHYARKQQVIRIDYENNQRAGESSYKTLRENMVEGCQDADAIIFSDYGYGVTDPKSLEACAAIASERGIPILVDSRSRLREFIGATSATPNQEEIGHILGANFSESDCEKLRRELNHDALLITRGNQGMLLLERGKDPVSFDAVGSKQPVDVTGAGDTVMATYALGLASGLSFSESAQLANHAGGIVVMKAGTATVTIGELQTSLKTKPSEYKVHNQ